MLQTYLGKGHSYVTNLANWLEGIGVIGPENGSKLRDVLVSNMDEIIAKANGKYTKTQKLEDAKMNPNKTTTKETKTSKKNSWVWGIIVIVAIILGIIGSNMKENDVKTKERPAEETSNSELLENFTGQDAKIVSSTLTTKGYTATYAFDRVNNGGFTDDQFCGREFRFGKL